MGINMTQKVKARFIVFFLLGTGCLLALLWKQNSMLRSLNEQSAAWLVETGAAGSDTISYFKQGEQNKKGRWLLNAVPVLAYLAGNEEKLAVREDKSMSEFAMLYPGRSLAKGTWSGAAAHWARGSRALEACDEIVLAKKEAEQEEEDAVETSLELDADAAVADAAMQENQTYREKKGKNSQKINKEEMVLSSGMDNQKKIQNLQRTGSLNYLLRNFYIVDSSTSINKKIFDVEALLNTNLSMKKTSEPQIYIFHTHGASEHFIDSKPGDKSESVVGVGTYLADILEKKYGYQVIHDETEYDRINGKIDRNKAYNKAATGLKKALKENKKGVVQK